MPIVTEDTAEIEDITDANEPCGPVKNFRFSDTGGLTQFGAFVEILQPGSRSSLCHWHAGEVEFIFMLSGVVTVFEGGAATPLLPGQTVCFKAGVPAGHYLKNQSDAEARYLVVGSRAKSDVVTYPDHDRVLYWNDETGERRFTTLDGTEGVGSAYKLPGA
jgi:uncharacterized cupin superfamily protein